MFQKTRLRFLISLLIAILVIGCEKENGVVVDVPREMLDFYAFAKGSFWEYVRSDDSTARDTVSVSFRSDCNQIVMDDEGRPGRQAGISFIAGWGEETILRHNDQSLEKFQKFPTGFLTYDAREWIFLFGDQTNSSELFYYSIDNNHFVDTEGDTVMSLLPIVVPAGNFSGYLIDNLRIALDDGYTSDSSRFIQSLFIVPKVGVVKYGISTTGFSSTTGPFEFETSWSLKSWELR